MFSRNRDDTHESGARRGIIPSHTASSLCFLQRNLAPAVSAGDGVSTYLALTFGTLLSSQGTVASFVLTLSGFPPGFPSVLRFRLYQIFPIRFPRCLSGFSLPRFPFPAVPTLSDPFGPDSQSAGFAFRAVGPFRRGETLADSRLPKPIGGRVLSNVDSSFRTHICRQRDADLNDRSSWSGVYCGMAVRGPTGVGAHVGQLGEHYVRGPGVSTRCGDGLRGVPSAP
jgi:hypothetical protein